MVKAAWANVKLALLAQTGLNSSPQAKTQRETGLWLASENEGWAKVAKEAGLKVE